MEKIYFGQGISGIIGHFGQGISKKLYFVKEITGKMSYVDQGISGDIFTPILSFYDL